MKRFVFLALLILTGVLSSRFLKVESASASAVYEIGTAVESQPYVTDLIDGYYGTIGTLTVSNDATYVTITYQVTYPDQTMCLTETHIYVSKEVPQTGAPGQFPYGDPWLGCKRTYVESIALADLGAVTGDTLYVAAHSETYLIVGYEQPDLSQLNIPTDYAILKSITTESNIAYWQIVLENAGALTGTHDAWCIDPGTLITNQPYGSTRLYSTYSPEAANFVDKPQNYDLVNYLINQEWVGKPSPSGATYTLYDVQWAIWMLVDNNGDAFPRYRSGWNKTRALELMNDAMAHGENYLPSCHGKIAVVVDPQIFGTKGQTLIMPMLLTDLGIECKPIGKESTAWALGKSKLPWGWGTYFEYLVH